MDENNKKKDGSLKKILKALLVKVKIYAIIVISIILLVGVLLFFIFDAYDGINEFDLFSGIFQEKEQQQIDVAYKQLYERVANTASYGVFSDIGDRDLSLIGNLLEYMKTEHPDIYLAMDFNDKFIHDANNNKVIGLTQKEAFDAVKKIKDYFQDADNKEEMYNLVDSTMLSVLNNEMYNNGDFESIGDIVYPEQFVKPISFINDYLRVDEKGEDYVYVVDWDEEGNVISEPIGKIYDFVIEEENENDYHKQVKGIHKSLPISYEVEEEEEENKYDNMYKPLKRKYYEIDEDGEPIVPKDEDPPRKRNQLVPLANEAGRVTIKSLTKYNISTKKVKTAIIDEEQVKVLAQKLYQENVETYDKLDATGSGRHIATGDARRMCEENAFFGDEGVDWEWNYDGETGTFGEIQKDNSLKYTAKEKEFRYIYYNKKVYDRVYYDFNNNKPKERNTPNTSYENKNLEFAWDLTKEKAVYKETGQIVPMVIDSVADYGLGTVNTYIEARSVEYMQAISVDEERDPEKINNYIQSNYNSSFREAKDGFYPVKIEEEDESIREETFNTDVIDYVGEMVASNSQNHSEHGLINEDTVGKNGEFLGTKDFNNKEFNKKVGVKTPYVESSWFNGLNIRDQATKPEKYYHYWYDKVNQDNSTLEFWVPLVANIADKINVGVFKDDGVNKSINLDKFNHNELLEEKKQEVEEKGEVEYIDPSKTKQIYLIDESTTFAGTFRHTYKEETRLSRPLSDEESKAVVDLYEVGRHWVADSWNVMVNVEETRYSRDPETDEWYSYTEDRSLSVASIPIDLEVYQSELISLDYNDSDMGRTIFTEGFLPNSDYTQTFDIKVPVIPYSDVDEYNFERGVPETYGYVESSVTGLSFELMITDNRNKGDLKEIYRYYHGAFYETRPQEENTYFEDEVLNDFRQRMTITDEVTMSEERRINMESEATVGYLEDYIRNFEAYIPNQVIKDYDAFTRTEDYYYDVVQNLENNKLSGDTDSLMGSVLGSFNTGSWQKAFKKMNLDIDKDKYIVAETILGLIEEEKKLINENRKGDLNIYAGEGVSTLSAGSYYDNKSSSDYVLEVNGSEDQRENRLMSTSYVSTSISNLVLRYNGDLNKAIMAYHITPEALDIAIDRASGTWSHRSQEEIVSLAKNYGGLDEPNLDPQIVEKALSYVGNIEGQQDIAKTSTKWYQELLRKAKNLTSDVVETTDSLLDKMFGKLYRSKDNRGMVYYTNHKSEMDYLKIVQRMMAMKKKEPFQEVSWELFDFFTGGSGSTLSGTGINATGTLEQFGGLIYNIETYVTPIGMATPPLCSAYGWRFHPIHHIWKIHNGLDIGLPSGTPILSIADGVVTASGWMGGYGYCVMVKHPVEEGNNNDYLISVYAHMVRPPLVSAGHPVQAGQTIGHIGSTGDSTGPHLHFEVNAYINPSNANYAEWSQYTNKEGKPSMNPFHFATSNPTPEQIAKYSITMPKRH